MGFVKTADEIAAIQHELSTPRFVATSTLSVVYETDPEAMQHALPPGFRVRGDTARAKVGRWVSNIGDFNGGALYLPATYEGLEGDYVIRMYMDRDRPTIFGRELYGEPKTLASTDLVRDADHVAGWLERDGVRIMELAADLDADLGPSRTLGRCFNIKLMWAPDGCSLLADPLVTLAEFDDHASVRRAGTGSISLCGTVHDPLDEFPTGKVVGAYYAEADARASCRVVGSIDRDTFMPYAYGRLDHYADLSTIAAPTSVGA
jgi:acetoacetate decarboxylase